MAHVWIIQYLWIEDLFHRKNRKFMSPASQDPNHLILKIYLMTQKLATEQIYVQLRAREWSS